MGNLKERGDSSAPEGAPVGTGRGATDGAPPEFVWYFNADGLDLGPAPSPAALRAVGRRMEAALAFAADVLEALGPRGWRAAFQVDTGVTVRVEKRAPEATVLADLDAMPPALRARLAAAELVLVDYGDRYVEARLTPHGLEPVTTTYWGTRAER